MGSGGIEEISVLSVQFCCEFKSALKSKSIKNENINTHNTHKICYNHTMSETITLNQFLNMKV